MHRWLGKHADVIYAVLRIVAGLMFACHGAQKLFGAFGMPKMTHIPLMLAAGIIELGCGLLVAAGFFASWAAFLASGQMACAYFMGHFPKSFWPIVNEGELAILYCFLFLYVAARGSGPLSVDAALRKR